MRQVVVQWTGGIPGYGDARVVGRYAISRPGIEIVTDAGTVPQFENRSAYFLRVANSGPRFAAAYSSAQPDRAKEWTGSAWEDRGLSCGMNPVIYSAANGLVVVAKCVAPTGAQGWRYLDDATGQLVTAESTYAPKVGEPQIWEYTAWPDFRIGQGQTGVKVWSQPTGTKAFSFEALRATGQLRNIHARRVGNDVAITVVDYDQHLTTVTWATMGEILGITVPPPNPLCTRCGRPKADHLRVPLVGGGETAVCPRNVYAV